MGDIRVLVVDDDEEMRELNELFIERESDCIEVVTESRPERVCEKLAAESFDCVVSDYRMPAMDGVELCEAVHEEFPGLPFFIFTASTGESMRETAEEAGVTGFVRKGAGTDHYADIARRIERAV